MAFHDVRFPEEISYGSSFGPGFMTTMVKTRSGKPHRLSDWEQARHQYDVGMGVRKPDQLLEVKTFHMARSGGKDTFRFKDFADFNTAADAGKWGDPSRDAVSATDVTHPVGGDGTTTTWQLVKIYSSGGFTKSRTITKPVAGTVVAAIDNATTTAFTVNTSTGVVTFDTAPADGTSISFGFEFDVEVYFDSTADQWLSMSIDSFEAGSLSIPLVEEKDTTSESHGIFWWGGASEATLDTASQIYTGSFVNGRVQSLTVTGSNVVVRLADPANLTYGGPYLYLFSSGSSTQPFELQDHNSVTLLADVDAGECATAVLANVSDVKTWVAFK